MHESSSAPQCIAVPIWPEHRFFDPVDGLQRERGGRQPRGLRPEMAEDPGSVRASAHAVLHEGTRGQVRRRPTLHTPRRDRSACSPAHRTGELEHRSSSTTAAAAHHVEIVMSLSARLVLLSGVVVPAGALLVGAYVALVSLALPMHFA
jgi:hypothetical protein